MYEIIVTFCLLASPSHCLNHAVYEAEEPLSIKQCIELSYSRSKDFLISNPGYTLRNIQCGVQREAI